MELGRQAAYIHNALRVLAGTQIKGKNMAQLKITMKRLSWLVIIGVPLWFIIAALGSKFGIWSWQFGLGKMTMAWGKYVMFAGLGIGVIAFITAIAKAPRTIDIIMAGLIAIIIPVMAMANGAGIKKKAASLPFIHDISTDWVDPPMFTEYILEQRGSDSNPVTYVGKKDPKGTALVSELQAEGYPDIQSQTFPEPADYVTEAVTIIAAENGLGFKLLPVRLNEGDILVQSTATTFWYGFKDDVIIRVRPNPSGGSIVDMRSVSRVGGSDLGANAERIRKLQAALAAKLEE